MPADDQPRDLTLLLHELKDVSAPSQEVTDRIYDAAYNELRRIASRLLVSQPAGHTLQPTALVHEAYVKLVGGDGVDWQGSAHFFAVAARAMRQILVNHARDKSAAKRGAGARRITLDDSIPAEEAGFSSCWRWTRP